MSLRSLPVLGLLIFTLSGCQQAAWKAGAGADDLNRDEQTCRKQTPDDDTAVKQCLRDKGWTITDFSTSAANENAALAAAASSNPAPSDPLQRQSVQTWWKAGALAADFHVDENICLEQLGTQHTPNYAQHLYTGAMINCLREHGWSAGRDPVYTPLR